MHFCRTLLRAPMLPLSVLSFAYAPFLMCRLSLSGSEYSPCRIDDILKVDESFRAEAWDNHELQDSNDRCLHARPIRKYRRPKRVLSLLHLLLKSTVPPQLPARSSAGALSGSADGQLRTLRILLIRFVRRRKLAGELVARPVPTNRLRKPTTPRNTNATTAGRSPWWPARARQEGVHHRQQNRT